MRRFLCLALALAALPAVAQADGPTPGQIATDLDVAVRYWHNVPACGWPRTGLTDLQLPPNKLGAFADIENCTILFVKGAQNALDYADYSVDTCLIIVHEYGHILLGRQAFAESNPADPAHSPDPHNIMYATLDFEGLASQVGCLPKVTPKRVKPRRKPKPKRHSRRSHRHARVQR